MAASADHEVVLLDRERGEAVIGILAYCNVNFLA